MRHVLIGLWILLGPLVAFDATAAPVIVAVASSAVAGWVVGLPAFASWSAAAVLAAKAGIGFVVSSKLPGKVDR